MYMRVIVRHFDFLYDFLIQIYTNNIPCVELMPIRCNADKHLIWSILPWCYIVQIQKLIDMLTHLKI